MLLIDFDVHVFSNTSTLNSEYPYVIMLSTPLKAYTVYVTDNICVQGKPGGLSKTPATRPTVCSLCCPQGDVSVASDPALAD